MRAAYAARLCCSSFVKFALLATGGEWIARRIKDHSYSLKGFGLFPKSIVWGVFGIFIYWAFKSSALELPPPSHFLQAAEPSGMRFAAGFSDFPLHEHDLFASVDAHPSPDG